VDGGFKEHFGLADYMALTGVISLICVLLLKDRTGHPDSH